VEVICFGEACLQERVSETRNYSVFFPRSAFKVSRTHKNSLNTSRNQASTFVVVASRFIHL